jgi:hypothetical protein
MKIVLELLGVPIDPEEMARKCPPTPERFGEAVAKDAMEKASGNTVVTPTTAQQMEQVAENPEAVPDVNPVSNTNEEQSQPQPTQKPTQKPTQQLNNDNPT